MGKVRGKGHVERGLGEGKKGKGERGMGKENGKLKAQS